MRYFVVLDPSFSFNGISLLCTAFQQTKFNRAEFNNHDDRLEHSREAENHLISSFKLLFQLWLSLLLIGLFVTAA